MNARGWRTIAWLLGTCCVLVEPGCGSPAPPPPVDAQVSGRVLIDGKPPATEGTIVFTPPVLGAPPREAPISKDGSYSVTALTGMNSVAVGGKLLSSNARLGYQIESFDVQKGNNTFDLTLNAPPPPTVHPGGPPKETRTELLLGRKRIGK